MFSIVDAELVLVHQVLEDAGVQIAGAGAHRQSGQRREAHGGVDGFAAVHRGDGGAVAEVAGDELERPRWACPAWLGARAET
jgi:hypothetical protein